MLVVEIIRDMERQAADLPDPVRRRVRSSIMQLIESQPLLESNNTARLIFHDAVTAFIGDRKQLVAYRLRTLIAELKG